MSKVNKPRVHALQGCQGWPVYHMGDVEAGSICCYADDSTLTCTESRPATLSNKLTNQYKVIAEYMRNNKLKLNDKILDNKRPAIFFSVLVRLPKWPKKKKSLATIGPFNAGLCI